MEIVKNLLLMEKLLLHHSQDLIRKLDIHTNTIEMAPFQGEMCTVFNANSGIHGELVIKTAIKGSQLSEEGQREIRQNKEGYECIPSSFRPEIIASDQEDTFLVMPNVGKPLRDLLWMNQHSLELSSKVAEGFLENLSQLLNETKVNDSEAGSSFLDQLQDMGQGFIKAKFFPNQLRDKFIFMVNHVRLNNDGVAAFATLDLTQGNLLIDTRQSPQALKVIDPKKPRTVNGKPTFLGIPEIDLGMFFATLNLNAPSAVRGLGLEGKIRDLGRSMRKDILLSDFSFNLGELFGCILIASFPNSVEQVEAYFKSVGAKFDKDMRNLVIGERERHVQKAMEIADSIEG